MTRRQAWALALLVPFAPLAAAVAWDALARRRLARLGKGAA